MKPVIVVLSHYPDLFRRFRDGLAAHEPSVSRMLIKDGDLIQKVPHNWCEICVERPFNYARNVNIGWKMSWPADVILCGDDVVVNGPFVDKLQEVAADPTVGVACAQLWGQSPFVCGYFRRDVIDAVGAMDENYTGYGQEDMDWCKRMEALGYHTQPGEIPVEHIGGTSYYRHVAETGETMEELCERSNALFRSKWPKR